MILYDREAQLNYVEFDGERRYLACEKPVKTYGLPKFGSKFPEIPPSEYREIDLEAEMRNDFPNLNNQAQQSSCVGHGSEIGFAIAWVQSGQQQQDFSPQFIYSWINGGRDAGANVHEAMVALIQHGCGLKSEVAYNQIFTRQISAAAKETALRFRLETAYDADSFAELMTGVQNRKGVVFGVEIGNAFRPDSQGIIGPQRGGGGGHCMCAVGAKLIGARGGKYFIPGVDPSQAGEYSAGGVWYPKVANSWGRNFGINGFCYMHPSYFTGEMGHYVPVAPTEDKNDPNAIPHAVK